MQLIAGLLAGLIATFAMDRVALFMVKRKLIQLQGLQIVPAFLGRWALGIWSCRMFACKDIREVAPKAGEVKAGWGLHYLIGAVLGALFFWLLPWHEMALPAVFLGGLAYGIFTNIFPWFMMYPAMGFGWLGSRLSAQRSVLIFSGLNHCVFGLTLGISLGAWQWMRLIL